MISKTSSKKPTAVTAAAKPGGKRPPVKPPHAPKGKPGGPGKVSGN